MTTVLQEPRAAPTPASNTSYPAGTAPVKAAFLLLPANNRPLVSGGAGGDDDSEGRGKARSGGGGGGDARGATDARDARDSRGPGGGGGKKKTKEEKKAGRGQNKARRFGKVRDGLDLCWRVATGSACDFGDACRFTHDIRSYLDAKPVDIHMPCVSQIIDNPSAEAASSDADPASPNPAAALQFAPTQESLVAPHAKFASIDVGTRCPVFDEMGECRYGFKCRFLGGHVRIAPAEAEAEEGVDITDELVLLADEERKARAAVAMKEANFVGADVQKALRSRKYATPIANEYLKKMAVEMEEQNPKPKPVPTVDSVVIGEPEPEDIVMAEPAPSEDPVQSVAPAVQEKEPEAQNKVDLETLVHKQIGNNVGSRESQKDAPDAKVRFAEKKRLNWKGLSYLAPLTTVGNLPFRRLCVDLGADITCGEMGLASSFLSGSKEEWSLVRRHPSERIFGVQIAGNKPASLVPTAEVLARECGPEGLDFVDLNCGCPIDLVFKSGSGSALLDSVGKLGKIVLGMNEALGSIPVTVKLRTGVKDGKNTAHKLMPRLATEWGASCITLHGRSRQQRYTRLADWDYIKSCVESVRAREADEDLPPVPIFGGGDCFSSQDYWARVEETGVDGVMIGRGALIKPWIFTEVKERREWDISARERLDLIRKFAEFGLNHFGSDTTGVNATRRYLCEALSFQYRYVPIGILECLPGRINDRAPAFRGRNELESLLSSPDSNDWVKITEMFLGPVPETWSFTPKHKSNAYGNEDSQG